MLGKLAFVAVIVVVAGALLRDEGGIADRPVARIPDPPSGRGVGGDEFAEIVAGMKAAHGLPLAGRSGRGPAAERPFADRGAPRRIARLRRDVARALRRASTPDDRVAVAAWQGIYVSGRRAVALADVRRAVRSRRGMPFRRLPLARTRMQLVRRGRAWRVLDVSALRR